MEPNILLEELDVISILHLWDYMVHAHEIHRVNTILID